MLPKKANTKHFIFFFGLKTKKHLEDKTDGLHESLFGRVGSKTRPPRSVKSGMSISSFLPMSNIESILEEDSVKIWSIIRILFMKYR